MTPHDCHSRNNLAADDQSAGNAAFNPATPGDTITSFGTGSETMVLAGDESTLDQGAGDSLQIAGGDKHLTYRRLRAPAASGSVLIDPPLTQAAGLVKRAICRRER